MDVAVRCNAGVPEDLRERAEEKVAKLSRYGPLADHAEVRVVEWPAAPVGERAACEVTLRGRGRRHIVRARARAKDATAAVDIAVSKVAHQLERMKGKVVGRSHPRHKATERSVGSSRPVARRASLPVARRASRAPS